MTGPSQPARQACQSIFCTLVVRGLDLLMGTKCLGMLAMHFPSSLRRIHPGAESLFIKMSGSPPPVGRGWGWCQRPGWLAVDGLAGRRLLHARAQSLGCQPGSLAVGHPRRLPATAQPSQPARLAGANVNISGRLLLVALPSPGTGTMLHPSAVISREAGALRGWSRKSSPRASRERRSKGPADASQ